MHATCHPERKLFSRGLCQTCYLRLRREERPLDIERAARGMALCRKCGEEKPADQFPQERGRPSSPCRACRVVASVAYRKARLAADPSYGDHIRRLRRDSARRYYRRNHLLYTHQMTPDDYKRLLDGQNGVCAICGRPPNPGRVLAVDHDHKTGLRRALLCDPCNRALGLFGDDPDRLRAAIEYLSRFP